MPQTLRAGVIGIGIGVHHARGFAAVEETELVALCDLDAERLRLRGAEFGDVQHYTDYKQMFAQADLDVVSIAVPNSLHPQMVEDALAAGLHIICEKPLAQDLAGSQAIVEMVAGADPALKFTVCYNKRYRTDILWLKDAIKRGVLGEIYHAEAGWKRETGIPGGWFSSKALAGGGPLIDLGVHLIDMALWLLDYPAVQTISGMTRAVFGPAGRKSWNDRSGSSNGYEVEDGALGLLRLAGGIPFLLEVSWADHRRPREDDMYFRFAGDQAAVSIHVPNYSEIDTVTIYTEVGGTPVTARPDLAMPRYRGHAGVIADFAQSILRDAPVPATAEHGLATMQILDAFYRSAESGREVALG